MKVGAQVKRHDRQLVGLEFDTLLAEIVGRVAAYVSFIDFDNSAAGAELGE